MIEAFILYIRLLCIKSISEKSTAHTIDDSVKHAF